MNDGKACKVCNFTRQTSYGVVAPSLDELKRKGEATHLASFINLFKPQTFCLENMVSV